MLGALNECVCICSCTTEPCGPSVTWPSHVSAQGLWTQHRGKLIPLTNKTEERGSEKKEERINQAQRKTKATGQGAQSVILPPLGVKRRERGGKRKKEV